MLLDNCYQIQSTVAVCATDLQEYGRQCIPYTNTVAEKEPKERHGTFRYTCAIMAAMSIFA